jgi:SAM-dependent methyltransferase
MVPRTEGDWPESAEEIRRFRNCRVAPGSGTIRAVVGAACAHHRVCPVGTVLELACGQGLWTGQLIQYADKVTAVDTSPEMLAIAATLVVSDKVRFLRANVFDWAPEHDAYRSPDELVEGESSTTIQRRLNDGTAHRIVKVPHHPADLEARLSALGWSVKVTPTSGPFYWGAGSLV